MKKNLFLKQIILLLLVLLAIPRNNFAQTGLPVYDKIDYPAGTLAYVSPNWMCLNTTPTNDVIVSSGSLSYSGLLASEGNKLSISGIGDEAVIFFGTQAVDSKVYFSFIFQITSLAGIAATTPTHFAGFSNASTTSSSWGCSVIIQVDALDASKFNIGHGTRSSLPVWNTVDGTPTGTPVKYSINTPIFIVSCYEIIGTYASGAPNDKSSMWINPSSATFEDALPPTANVTGQLTGTTPNDIDFVNRLYLRQDAATTTPPIEIDEIRIGLSWASVTPKSVATGTKAIVSEANIADFYPNPVNDVLKVDLHGSEINSIEIYTLSGIRIISHYVKSGINTIDVSNLTNGTYVVSFIGPGVSYSKKLVKK